MVCFGNIYLGGTGKTPLSIFVSKELILRKKRPAIIKKYYSAHFDEHNLIRNELNYLFLNKRRTLAINDALREKCDFMILDDGFQDYSVKKNLNILCFSSQQLIGNGMTIPSGPLRENFNSIKKAGIIIINGNKNLEFENKIKKISNDIKIFYTKYISLNTDELKDKNLFAFAGIGNPSNFFKLLSDSNLKIHKKIEFPDHYNFKRSEIEQMVNFSNKENLQLVTTEKDFFRIKKYGFKEIKFIKLGLEIDKKDELINYILNVKS